VAGIDPVDSIQKRRQCVKSATLDFGRTSRVAIEMKKAIGTNGFFKKSLVGRGLPNNTRN